MTTYLPLLQFKDLVVLPKVQINWFSQNTLGETGKLDDRVLKDVYKFIS